MESKQDCDIFNLVRATEQNISRITVISGRFAVPCLNEWRYATRHVACLLKDPNDTVQRDKAIGHLKRAYYDSCDILLTILIDSLRKVFDDVGEYVDVANKVLPGFASWNSICAEAIHLQREAPDDRYSRAIEMDKMSAKIIKLLDQADANRSNLLSSVARKRNKDRFATIGVISAAITAVAAVIKIFFN